LILGTWTAMALVAAMLACVFVAVSQFRKRFNPQPETSRKLLHIGMGPVILAFPWVFETAWPVLALCACVLGAMAILRSRPAVGVFADWGHSLHDIRRSSWGDFCYPLATAILFVVAHQEPMLYVIPMLLLIIADAVAALIGQSYGLHAYQTLDGTKTLEGSIAFFQSAFLSVLLALILFTEVGRKETVLIALMLGLLVTLFEAVAWRGLDNLFVPLGGFLLLKIYLAMDMRQLLARALVLCSLLAAIVFLRRRTTLNDSGVVGSVLAGYVSWAIGGWHWLLPPVIALCFYSMVVPKPNSHGRHSTLQSVFYVTAPGLFWLFLGHTLNKPLLVLPYTIAYGLQLTMSAVARRRFLGRPALMAVSGKSALEAWSLMLIPFLLLQDAPISTPWLPLMVLPIDASVALFFAYTQTPRPDYPRDMSRLHVQTWIALAVSILCWFMFDAWQQPWNA